MYIFTTSFATIFAVVVVIAMGQLDQGLAFFFGNGVCACVCVCTFVCVCVCVYAYVHTFYH